MPLSNQEKRCIKLATSQLNKIRGGRWKTASGPTLDELYPSEPSPEVLVTNGILTAAVEVKRLSGDREFNEFIASAFSLHRSLVPSCGGYYILSTCPGFQLPIEPSLVRYLRREIERVSKSMSAGDNAAIPIQREALIHSKQKGGHGLIHCCHDLTGGIVQGLSDRVSGAFFLDDCGEWEHSFITDEAREAFSEAVVAACQECEQGSSKQAKWYEEWGLWRLQSDIDGVEVAAATSARDLLGATHEAIRTMLDKGKAKFVGRRWADLNVLVLEMNGVMVSIDRVLKVIRSLPFNEFKPLDLVLLVEGERVVNAWMSDTLSA